MMIMVIYRFTLQKTAIIGIALSDIDIFFRDNVAFGNPGKQK